MTSGNERVAELGSLNAQASGIATTGIVTTGSYLLMGKYNKKSKHKLLYSSLIGIATGAGVYWYSANAAYIAIKE